ncbi:hypothetical protein T265_12141 [Opisthorchis viverrini]|uniref:Uncharacterized protein n=1 Tax=Opisthorchis viverrini TaxID=6198 RepID=A0A074YVM4_OPIVI|nr:hypothetical protein T265_12141 [Opisthorchis viverrini]KER18821.1 hypothetical protein T265_12141 [Opisthorchis viverrini]
MWRDVGRRLAYSPQNGERRKLYNCVPANTHGLCWNDIAAQSLQAGLLSASQHMSLDDSYSETFTNLKELANVHY